LRDPGAILFLSCYELGHQPLSLASPAALLRRAGYEPALLDLSQAKLDDEAVRRARLIAVSVPMHTALRLGVRAAERIRALNPEARLCFYGLYASLNAEALFRRGIDAVAGGEVEEPLLRLAQSAERGDAGPVPGIRTAAHAASPWLERIPFEVPDRGGLPPLDRYVRLEVDGETRVAGQVEASRGCLHLCRHCPIPPVYGGRFFVVPRETVLADIRQQVEAGAAHISFGDPDFLNGPGHVMAVARALHAEFPAVTFDVTAKIEHLLRHRDHLPELRDLGCLFIVSAVESLNDGLLAILDKGHTRDDVETALRLTEAAGLTLRPTFVPFTPWTSLDDYRDLLAFIEDWDLVDAIDPVQLSIRLLVPPGSLLAEHPAFLPFRGPLDEARFTYRWTHPDARLERLHRDVTAIVERAAQSAEAAADTFEHVAVAAGRARAAGGRAAGRVAAATDRAAIDGPVPRSLRMPPARRDKGRAPRLTEPWFC
jgi:radical SAM superfamily enzyme YgiQ (UPF0313 family)